MMGGAPRAAPDPRSPSLLLLGALAGPLYVIVATAQILTREGFDVHRHAVSLLANGDLGWIQVANFMLAGALVVAGAVGLRRRLWGAPGGTWGPILLAVYGIGMVGAGVFVADPGGGFPPGTPDPDGMTRSGLLHFVFGALGFYALIAACFVFARRFFATGRTAWAAWSGGTGAAFLFAFVRISSGSTAPGTILGLYVAVFLAWVWLTALMGSEAREAVEAARA